MPADILRLRMDLTNNLASIMLGTVRNDGNQTFRDTLSIEHDGGPPIPFLSLPSIFPQCSWAAIKLTIYGCVSSSQGVTLAGLTIPGWTPPSGLPLIVGPPPVSASLSPLIITTGMMVGLPLPTIQPGGGPGILDHWSTVGNRYKIDFEVTPLPGMLGLKTWEFELSPLGERIVVSASLLEPSREKSE